MVEKYSDFVKKTLVDYYEKYYLEIAQQLGVKNNYAEIFPIQEFKIDSEWKLIEV